MAILGRGGPKTPKQKEGWFGRDPGERRQEKLIQLSFGLRRWLSAGG